MQRAHCLAALAISSALLAALGCGPPKVALSTAKTKEQRPAFRVEQAAPLLPTYQFNDGAGPGDSVEADGSLRLLRAGDRLLVSPSREVQVSSMRAPGDLMGGVAVPARFGGGFLFWTAGVLYRSRTYLGPLEAVAAVPTNALAVQFGWDSVLLSFDGGRRRQYRLEQPARVPLSPRNVLEVAASDDGRVIALDAAGRALASIDRGQSFRDVSSLVSKIRALHGEPSAAWFEIEGDTGAFLLADGGFEQRKLEQPAERAPADAEAARKLDILDRALSDGVWVAPGQAAVARGAELWLVDVKRREPTGGARKVADPGFECEALSAAHAVLLACFHPQEGIAIVSRGASAAPVTEKRFEQSPSVAYAKGVLLVAASCNGKAKPGVACVRSENGTWAEHDLSAQIAAAAPGERRFQQFIPKQGGGAAALVAEGSGSGESERWRLIGVRAEPTLLDQPLPRLVRGPSLGSYSNGRYQHTYRKRVDTSWVVLRDGTLRGFSLARSLAVTPQGNVRLDPRTFDALARRDGRAVGRDPEGHLFQTLDFGETWSQVAAPPYDEPTLHGFDADCSEVGCYLGNWVRNGWPNEPARPERVFEKADVLPSEAAARGPRLQCTPRGEKKPIPTPPIRVADLRFQETSSGSGSASMGLFGPLRWLAEPKTLRFSWLEPFEPALGWRASQLDAAEWTSVRRKPRLQLPRDGGTRPLLSSEPGHVAGILVHGGRDATPLWVGTNGRNRPFANWRGTQPRSGYVDARGKVWLLGSNCQGVVSVTDAENGASRMRLGPAYSEPAFHRRRGPESMFLPPCPGFENPEVIGVDAQGELAVLRLPSANTPATADEPALALRPASEPIALAPWSTLELASSPACASNSEGYRALIQTPESWLGAGAGGANSAMSALVRWSPTRVCLEAVEAPSELTREARLVARFVGKGPGAAIVREVGDEAYRQPVTCEVVSAVSAAP